MLVLTLQAPNACIKHNLIMCIPLHYQVPHRHLGSFLVEEEVYPRGINNLENSLKEHQDLYNNPPMKFYYMYFVISSIHFYFSQGYFSAWSKHRNNSGYKRNMKFLDTQDKFIWRISNNGFWVSPSLLYMNIQLVAIGINIIHCSVYSTVHHCVLWIL